MEVQTGVVYPEGRPMLESAPFTTAIYHLWQINRATGQIAALIHASDQWCQHTQLSKAQEINNSS